MSDQQARPLGRFPMWGGRSPSEAFGARRRNEPVTPRYPANVSARDVVGLFLVVAGAGAVATGAAMLLGPGGAFLAVGVVMLVLGVLLGMGE